MNPYDTAEAAREAVEDIFNDEASQHFMAPILCQRFLVSNGPDGDSIVLALGGGGVYGTLDQSGKENHFAVARVATAVMLKREVALALAGALTGAASSEIDDGD